MGGLTYSLELGFLKERDRIFARDDPMDALGPVEEIFEIRGSICHNNLKKMIKFNFTDLREREKWQGVSLAHDSDKLVEPGMNLAGNCINKIDGIVCGEYNILRVGFINKQEGIEHTQIYQDIR